MKGQLGIMEYVVMTFFIIVILIVLFFFLTGWQISQFSLEARKGSGDRALSLSKSVMNSQYFVKDSSRLDDGKLTALASMGQDGCEKMEEFFGDNWFFEVQILDGSGPVECDWNNYPDCNYWSFCMEDSNNVSFSFPVNIYRNIGYTLSETVIGRTDIANLRVGVYTR